MTKSSAPHPAVAPVITFLLALGVYLLTLAPDLTWGHFGVDGGELIAAATTLGVPHPPGYPTYTLLGHLISLIPLGNIPFRFNLFSALCMAAAAAFVTASAQGFQVSSFKFQVSGFKSPVSQSLSLQSPVPILTGLTFAFTELVWGQAVITEVYALNLVCLALFLWLLLSQQSAFWVGLALGLSLTTHLSSGLMLPLAVWAVGRGRVSSLLSGLLLGLTPYLLIPLLAQNPTPIVWGDPSTVTGWLWLISGHLFASNVFALPLAQWPSRLVEWGFSPFNQFTPLGLPLLFYGLYALRGLGEITVVPPLRTTQHARRNTHDDQEGETTGNLMPGNPPTPTPVVPPLRTTQPATRNPQHALLITALAYFLYAFTYTSVDAIIFLLPALLLLSILLTFGLQTLGKWGWVLPLTLVALNFEAVNLRDDMGPRPQANQLLQAIPQGAVLLVPGDETLFTLWALQQGEGQRPDLILVDTNLFAFDWYRQRLARLYPQLTALQEDDVAGFHQENQRHQPVCEATIHQPQTLICDGPELESNNPQPPSFLYFISWHPPAFAVAGAKSCAGNANCPIAPGAATPGRNDVSGWFGAHQPRSGRRFGIRFA